MFLVPKFLPGADGKAGRRNDVFCAGLEDKLGIHGSPTCTMIYGDGRYGGEAGAVGWLIGEENRGLAAMFTMMNNARLMVGVQGVGQAERALQLAEAYARERRQGRAPGQGGGASPIAAHPDVRRMLMTMRALTSASRALCYACAFATDVAATAPADARWRERAELLTPVAKAFATDAAFHVASLGVQVHGGAGYIEETGAAQVLRDSRIAAIYEGTNGIQAIDLVTRKLPLSDGETFGAYVAELRRVAERAWAENRPAFGRMGARLASALDDLEASGAHLASLLKQGRNDGALAGATPFLRLFGLAAGGVYLAKAALSSRQNEAEAALRIATARFFAENLAPETGALRLAIVEGAEAVLAGDASADR
jgi:hypothetical protein